MNREPILTDANDVVTRSDAYFQVMRNMLLGFLVLCAVVLNSGVAAAADWVVNINDTGSDPIGAGGTIIYNVRVDNNLTTAAPSTPITLTIPAGGEFLGATGAITSCAPTPVIGPATVTCTVPALAGEAIASMAVSILTSAPGTIILEAEIPPDDDSANNLGSQETTITAGANLRLEVSGPATTASGSTASYTFTTTNLGPNTGGNMTLTIPVPTGLANIIVPPSCSLSGSNYICNISGPLANGGTTDLIFSGTVSAAASSTVTVVGSIVGNDIADPITSNNTDDINTTITAGTDLTIGKSRSPAGPLLIGDSATFTLTPSYSGDSPSMMTITDTIPANYSINSVTPAVGSGWTCTVTGQLISCSRTSGSGAGANVSLGAISIDTTIVSAGTPTNIATIGAAGPTDQNPSNNTASDGGATLLAPSVDLRANKSGPTAPALVVVGNTYDFSISTTNLGNAPFVGTLVMEDALPAGLEVTAYAENGWTCLPAVTVVGPTTINCQRIYPAFAPLAVGATTPSVQLTSLVTASGSISNGLTVSSPDANFADPDLSNNTIAYAVTSIAASAAADISVLKRRSLATLAAGAVQTFELEVVNAGPATSTGVVLTDDLTSLINGNEGPTGSGFISSVITNNSASGLSCTNSSSGGTSRYLSCDIASLPVCTAGTNCPIITVEVRPGGDAGTRTNYANVTSNDIADPSLGNNSGNASYDIEPRADVTVNKVGSPDPAVAGQNLTYVVTATNVANGLSSSANTTITDTLPNNVTFVSASPSSGSCAATPLVGSTTSSGNNQIVCNLGTLGNGAQQTLTVVVRPNFVTRGTTITNVADISTTTLGDDLLNNSATAPIPVGNPALDLLVNKSDSADPTPVGEDMVYTMIVTNNGPSAAENVIVTDNLPTSRLTFVSHTVPADGTCTTVPTVGSFSGVLQCSFPRLEAGETRTLTVTMNGDAKGVTTNRVNATSDEVLANFDTLPSNNNDAETTTVRTRVDVEVTSKVATPATVNLREPFNYTIVVRNKAGALLGDADSVVLSDSLPSNMVLTAAPSAVISNGTTTTNTCTGASGDVSFTCSFGTVSNPGEMTITVPVMVTTTSAQPQTFTNTASVATSSYDILTTNNSNSGNVAVNSSSISGTVYRDFNNDGSQVGTDTGVAGIPMTLSGTTTDGTPVSVVVNTDSNGNYNFPFLAAGNYTVTRGTISEAHLATGQSLPGPNGGTAASPTLINSISLGDNTAEPDYDFTVIPQARIGIAKSVTAGPTTNIDGSFNVTFRLVVNNFSLEALNNVAVTDALTGGSPLFGAHQNLGAPATDALSVGQYTVLTAPSGTCGGSNAGFNGSGATTVASGFGLAIAGSCTIDFALRVQPTNPLPPILPSGGRYDNQAQVTGEGVLSGQTSATNPSLTDLSDNGATADANSNGIAGDAGENDPTPVLPTLAPAITLVKTGVPNLGGNGQIDADEVIDYSFVVRNSGNVVLNSIAITDAMVGTVTCPVTSLNPGVSTTCTGSYMVVQADINAGVKVNTATVSGTPPSGPAVEDVSDGAIAGPLNNNNTQTALTQVPRITLVKEAAAPTVAAGISATEVDADDTIEYTFTVANAGNVPLTSVGVTDAKVGTVTCVATTLAVGQSTTCSAMYTILQSDMNAGEVVNTAIAAGTSPLSVVVNDTSDEATPGNAAGENDPTVTPLAQAPRISLIKDIGSITDGDGNGTDQGDTISYLFTVTNTGTVTLNTVGVTDAKVANISCAATTLLPGDQTTCTGDDYVITLADVNAGQVENTATASGTPPATLANPTPAPVTDISDQTNPGSGAGNDDPTITPLGQTPTITLVKTAAAPTIALGLDATIPDEDDTIDYEFAVENTGNVTLSPITVEDAKVGAVSCPVASLAPGVSTICTATYTVQLVDMNAGQVVNTATAYGTPPATLANPTPARVSDISDESTPGAGPALDDPTITPLSQTPRISLVKTAATPTINKGADAGIPDVGDTIAYSFVVKNEGSVTLTGVAVIDPKVGAVTCPVTTLAPNVSTTCTADYVMTQDDINLGTVTNTATARGTPPTGPVVEDISGSAVGNDDPTMTNIPRVPRLGIAKEMTGTKDIDKNGFVTVGDKLLYTVTATNTGNVTQTNIVVTDSKITPSSKTCATLAPTQTCVLKGELTVTNADLRDGGVKNVAQTASDEFAIAVEAETNTPVFPIIRPDQFTKVALISNAKRGERVPYVIEAIDVPLNPVRIIDIMPPGFSYVAGSAKANGVAVKPTVKGQALTFNGLSPDTGDDLKLELTLIANASVATGPAVNKAQLIYPNSGTLLATAQASVTIIAEPVFDCGDVIGKVFNDRNGNGIQDAETSPYIPELGLPGVRVATVRGRLITTDKNGLFHIPCADIPDADIGSNFIVKLDTRTLPTGYRLTTENPRKVRLTRGKMTKLNFGAAISRVVTLDLNGKVFENGSTELLPKWREGLLGLVATLAQEPSTLRINYVGTTNKALAQARMRVVSNSIQTLWRQEKGRYRLPIETRTISAEGQAAQ